MNTHHFAAALVFLSIPATVTPLEAQRLAPVLQGFSAPTFPSPRADSIRRSPTYWQEGALVGGLSTGLLFAYVANGFCNDSDSNPSGRGCLLPTVGGLVMGAIPGIVVGAIIGSGFHKHPRR